MPSKNTLKTSVENSYYHIYNRGVEKRNIFLDEQDYHVFLNYLKVALSPPEMVEPVKLRVQGTSLYQFIRPVKNFKDEIELVCYCLMPNHFHLLIKQIKKGSMETFTRSVLTRYSMYFNKKYDRVGTLFQGRYKAAMVLQDPYLLHLSRYIHLNPYEFNHDLLNSYSSYAYFLLKKKSEWVKPDIILNFFNNSVIPELKKINSYKYFVEKYKSDSKDYIGEIALD